MDQFGPQDREDLPLTIEATPTPNLTSESADTAALLGQVLARLDGLEAKVDRIQAAAEPVPKLVSGAVDTIDDLIRSGQARGIDLDQRLSSGALLLERLSEPATLDKLSHLLERIDVLDETVEQAAAAPQLVAMTADMVDEWIRARQAEGVDVHATLDAVGALVRALSQPEVLAAAQSLTSKLPEVARFAEDGPKLAAMLMDTFDELSNQAARQGIEVDNAIKSFLTAGLRLTEVLDSPQFKALLSSDVLAPETLEVVGSAGRALAEQSSAECRKAGLLTALSASQKADVQRAIYFGLGFAERFGRQMCVSKEEE